MSCLYRRWVGVFAPASTATRAGAREMSDPPGVVAPAPGVRDAAERRAGVVVAAGAAAPGGLKTLIGRDACASIPGVRAGVLANCAIFAAPGVFHPAFETPTFSGDVTLWLALGLLFQALGVRAALAAGVLTRPGVFRMPRPGVTAGAGYALCVATFSSSSMCTEEGGSHRMPPCDRPRPGVDIARGGGEVRPRARAASNCASRNTKTLEVPLFRFDVSIPNSSARSRPPSANFRFVLWRPFGVFSRFSSAADSSSRRAPDSLLAARSGRSDSRTRPPFQTAPRGTGRRTQRRRTRGRALRWRRSNRRRASPAPRARRWRGKSTTCPSC